MKSDYTPEQWKKLKEIREELRLISKERRQSLKDYRYWKRLEDKITK